jgi:hypothetical protein
MTDDVLAMIAALPERRRHDAEALVALMSEVTGEQPALWSGSIVGFGSRHYRYESGREGDTVRVGFAPRGTGPVLYLTHAVEDYGDLLERLGPHTHGKGCLYLKRVADVDAAVLRELVARSYRDGGEG